MKGHQCSREAAKGLRQGLAYVEKGLTIGVFQIEDKCTILLNLSASRQEGISFAADLLRLAKVIR